MEKIELFYLNKEFKIYRNKTFEKGRKLKSK